MAVEIGTLRALLSLDSAAFDKGAKRAQASMNGLQRSLTKTADKMKAIGRKMTTRVTAPIVATTGLMVRSSLKTVDAQAKMAESLDTSVVSIQNLTRASDLAGISQEDLDGSLRRMTRRISLAEQGTGAAVDAFEQLNLSASDLADLPADKRVELITDRIREMIPEAEQAGVASKVFGDKTGLAIMRLDSDVIARATAEIERFGFAISETDAKQIQETNDALSSVSLAVRGLSNQLTVALAPALEQMADRIASVVAWFADLSPEMKRFAGISVTVTAAIGPLAIALGFVAAGLAALASPIGLAILAFGAVAGAATYVAIKWDDLIERFPWLETGMKKVGNVMLSVWEGIKGVVTGAADIVNGAIDTIIGVLTGDLTRAVEGLTGMWKGWKDVTDAALNAVLGVIEAIVPGFTQAASDIIAAVSELPAKLMQWGKDAIQGFVDGIKQKWAELKESVTSIFRLDDVGARSIEEGKQLGRDLGTGLPLGVMETLPEAESAIREHLNSLEDAARDESETQSPSRVWMRLGRDLMDGLAVGIDGNAQKAATAAGEAASNVTDAVSDSLGSMTTLKQGFVSVFSSILTGTQSFADSMASVLNSLGSRLLNSGLSGLADMIFGGFGGGSSVSGANILGATSAFIGSNASGTDFWRGGPTRINEQGGEILNLPRGTQIIPNDISKRMADGQGGSNVTLHYAPVIDARGADQAAVGRLESQLRQQAASFEARVHQTLRKGANRGLNARWQES